MYKQRQTNSRIRYTGLTGSYGTTSQGSLGRHLLSVTIGTVGSGVQVTLASS